MARFVRLATKLAKAWFGQVGTQVSQVKEQVGQGQGQELDNMFCKTTWLSCFMSTNCTWIIETFMNWFFMLFKTVQSCCLIVTQCARIPLLFMSWFEMYIPSYYHIDHIYILYLYEQNMWKSWKWISPNFVFIRIPIYVYQGNCTRKLQGLFYWRTNKN